MFRYIAILFLMISFSMPALSLTIKIRRVEGGVYPNTCSRTNEKITIAVVGATSQTTSVNLTISCAANDYDTKTQRWSGTININGDGEGTSDGIVPAKHNISGGSYCAITGASVQNPAETGTGSFEVDYDKQAPPEVVGNGVNVGEYFTLKLPPGPAGTSDTAYKTLLLRECTADVDPWLFTHIPYKIYYPEKDNLLVRVYPTLTTTIPFIKTEQNHGFSCPNGHTYVMKHLITVSDNHADYQNCKMKIKIAEDIEDEYGRVIANVVGGDTFNAQGNPTLASNAAVTSSNGKIMLHTGSKPSNPANIATDIEVQVSADAGYTWRESAKITAWTSAATDTGITAAANNADNMVMLKMTDGNKTWWRIIKGQ